MEQRCHVSMIWLTWLGLPLLAIVVGLRRGVLTGAAVLAIGVLAQVAYMRAFPAISRFMGYGSVADVPAPADVRPATALEVTFYTANVCPFCPIVKARLRELQQRHHFALREVDVTFRPEILRARQIRSVPVLEANGRMLVGNVTSAQIAAFLAEAPAGARRELSPLEA